MSYQETLDYLFNALPMFQRIGAAAFKKDLENTKVLCSHLGNPEKAFKSIHIAGTNGKGSTAHALCSVLMEAGYKTGLYTSPHLKSFTERIKINGMPIPEEEVVSFVAANRGFLDALKPSFFEMTVGMAFWYFAKSKVDIAVIEVGMGGRLDSTNVISPELCVITNIGMDHMQFLGNTLAEIAAEKAGTIKPKTPVVISQRQKETAAVFEEKAKEMHAPIYFASDEYKLMDTQMNAAGQRVFDIEKQGQFEQYEMDLSGKYQAYNLPGILKALELLKELGWEVQKEHVQAGLRKVITSTGLKGRWQILGRQPLVICDTGHNEDGIKEILSQLDQINYDHLFMVIGMVADKDVGKILAILPKDAKYLFCEANIPRALDAELLKSIAASLGLNGEVEKNVNVAIEKAKSMAKNDDCIFVGGSTFVVAEIADL